MRPLSSTILVLVGIGLCGLGLLTSYLAATSLRSRRCGSGGVMAFAGLTSIGWMAVVNFLIGSDFRWPLLAVAGLWAVAMVLYRNGE